MKFGSVPVSEAENCLLAHALLLGQSRFKKGHLITLEDIDRMIAGGMETVTVARLEPDDVEENAAAERIARGLSRSGLSLAAPFTGRVNLYAEKTALFFACKDQVDQINRISPSITLATLADGTFVEAGRMVATVKIIPFAAAENDVQTAENLMTRKETLTVTPSAPACVGLISTVFPSLKPSVMDKTYRVLVERLAVTGSRVAGEQRVEHSAQAVSGALIAQKDTCDFHIIFGASAITDVNDVIPQAIRLAGGEVHHFGMPVDPGNLLLTGTFNGKPVIGAPGCARSPAENGFDWVLQRLLCGLPVDENYISGLGVGGLLMEISARPQPREK